MTRRLPPPLRLAIASSLTLLAWMPTSARSETLQEVFDAARQYDAAYLAARAQAESVPYQAQQARAARRPSVGLQAGLSRANSDTPLYGDRHTNTTSLGLQAQQSLFNRASGKAIEQADKAAEIATSDLQAAEQDLIVRVSQAYFDVLAARDTVASAQANQKAIGVQLASAKRNFEVGTATITDTREAQARSDLASAQLIAADNDLRIKRQYLDQLVGRPGVDPRPLTQPVALPPLPSDGAEAWVARSSESPSVRKALLGKDIAALEVQRARAGHLPTAALTGTLGQARNTGSGASSSGGEGHSTSSSVGVNLNWPLFTGFAVQNQVKQSLKLEEKAENDALNAQRSVAQAVRQAYFGVESGQARVKALEAAEASSKLAVEATQLGYKVGVRVNLDVLNAQNQLYSTQTELAKARYDLLMTHLRLQQATGTLTAAALPPIDAALKR